MSDTNWDGREFTQHNDEMDLIRYGGITIVCPSCERRLVLTPSPDSGAPNKIPEVSCFDCRLSFFVTSMHSLLPGGFRIEFTVEQIDDEPEIEDRIQPSCPLCGEPAAEWTEMTEDTKVYTIDSVRNFGEKSSATIEFVCKACGAATTMRTMKEDG